MATLATALFLPTITSAQGIGLGVGLQAQAKVDAKQNNGLHLGQLKQEHKKEEAKVAASEKKPQVKNMTLLGTVVSLDGSNITLRLTANTTVVVDASKAKLIRRFGAAMQLSDIQVNDQLFIRGVAEGDVIRATLVQDLSLQARHGTFVGTVAAVSSTNSFTLQSRERGLQTINVTADTKIQKNGEPATFADIMVGSQVTVNGVWDRTNSNVTAERIMIRVPTTRIHVAGTITALSEHTITVASAGTTTTSYTVNARSAVIVFSTYQRAHFRDLQVGDEVDVWGMHEQNSTQIKAYFIRDLSQMNATTQIVNMDDNNTTLKVTVGDQLLLKLGDRYTWSVTSSNPGVLRLVRNPATGNQGVYKAQTAGHAELMATGTPKCLTETPACAMPSVSFHLNVDVMGSTTTH